MKLQGLSKSELTGLKTNGIKCSAPIGVFDSGLGGLTVARQLRRVLPHEDLLYLGDTARVPYGNKSHETVTRYATEATQYLVGKGVKLVVIACNTASAWALKSLKRQFQIPIIGVVIPGVEAALRYHPKRLGIIATTATIRSGAYQEAVRSHDSTVKVFAKACPLLVPLVEEGWQNHQATKLILKDYLQELIDAKVDTLVLGCTHYPFLKQAIRNVTQNKMRLVDSARACAEFTAEQLAKLNLLNSSKRKVGRAHTFVTDHEPRFDRLAGELLNAPRLRATILKSLTESQ